MVTIEIIQYITLGAVALGMVVNITGLVNKSSEKAAAGARVEVKLDNIYTKVDCIEKNYSGIEVKVNNHDVEIATLKDSTKSAHHRIDEIVGKDKYK